MDHGSASGHSDGRAEGDEVSVLRHRYLGGAVCPRHLGDRMHLGALLREGRTELGDVDDDVLVRCRRELAGVLALGAHRRLVHVEHVQRHLDHAEGEPKDIRELQKTI
jgi:hypothetical protein